MPPPIAPAVVLPFTKALDAARARLEAIEGEYLAIGRRVLELTADRDLVRAEIKQLSRTGRPRRACR